MALLSLYLAAAIYFISGASAAFDTRLVGTWTTKSAAVLTGPGFYNPVNDSFIEPKHTGISYSFTADGFYEEAYYRAIANPVDPSCPQAILQFQHGTYTITATTPPGLELIPFGVDGRQLLSNPCSAAGKKGLSAYTRYIQSESMEKYTVSKDAYSGATRLDIYQFDGTPIQPMYLAYNPPQMLPTITMNPTTAATGAAATAHAKAKRELGMDLPLNRGAKHIERGLERKPVDAGLVWWIGVGMTVIGGAAYLL